VAQRDFRCNTNRLKLLLSDSLPVAQQAEVVGHLDGCSTCQQALERLAADREWWDELPQLTTTAGPVAGLTQPNDAMRPFDLAGSGFTADFLDPGDDPSHLGRLGPFVVTEFLGRGGMGIVLKAFDTSLNRTVAIKVLAPYFASSGAARRRFDREARAAAAVVHEHVVPIFHVDNWKGLPYLVMACVAGRSLQERIDADGPLAVKEVLRIGMQAARGLAAAHAQGLVHRDVKPANILLENGVERVWLTDFGLARAVDDASLTQSGVVTGTPQYMSPEQAKGDPVDLRTDLFSLGSTLYAMCAGHAPFRAESAWAVLRRVCDEPPRPLREVNPDVPEWLADIITKLHAKEPTGRFQSAAEVAELLGQWLSHLQQPATVPPPVTAQPRIAGQRWIAAVLLLLSVAVAAPFAWKAIHPTIHRELDSRIEQLGESATGDEPGPTLDELRQHLQIIEAELKQQGVGGYGDPAESQLHDMHRRLDALERELSPPPRGK
jgi:serine/threonine-protein kinase